MRSKICFFPDCFFKFYMRKKLMDYPQSNCYLNYSKPLNFGRPIFGVRYFCYIPSFFYIVLQ